MSDKSLNSTHPTGFDALIEKAMAHTQALQSAHSKTWNMGDADRFDVDLEQDIISWTFVNEKIVSAPATLIGTWSGNDDSFLWGWDHPMSPPANANAAQAVKDYADKHNIGLLQDRKLNCALEDVWQLSAIAVLISDLQGVYRAPSGGSFVLIGFGEITISPYT